MSDLIKRIHHISLKCTKDEVEKVQHFYRDILGLPIIRSWGEPEVEGFMIGTGSGIIEVFVNAEDQPGQGAVRHFALATDEVDKCVELVREAGYEVFVEPDDLVIPTNPPFPLRMAFCHGPVGEEIEFFQEK